MSENISNDIKLPTGEKLVLSSSPHISANGNVRGIMLKVITALLPAAADGIWFFGLPAAAVIVLTVISCVIAEAVWCLLAGKPVIPAITDFSAVVTGVILALNLPSAVPFYIPVIGGFIAIWLGKQVFGGLGHNPFNPAIVARVALLIALPAAMTIWSPPRGMDKDYPAAELFFGSVAMKQVKQGKLDGISCATPLGIMTDTEKITDTSDRHASAAAKHNFDRINTPALLKKYFWGIRPGCIGETCIPALILGGIMLIIFKLINWRVPVCFIGAVAVTSGLVNFFFPGVTPPPLFHLFTGGVFLGAVFMATDMVSSPVTNRGCLIFGIGCGVITSVIRIWGNYPEGVSFGILIMNALVPLIDRWCAKRPFGYIRRKEV